jgi:hypothetical protein
MSPSSRRRAFVVALKCPNIIYAVLGENFKTRLATCSRHPFALERRTPHPQNRTHADNVNNHHPLRARMLDARRSSSPRPPRPAPRPSTLSRARVRSPRAARRAAAPPWPTGYPSQSSVDYSTDQRNRRASHRIAVPPRARGATRARGASARERLGAGESPIVDAARAGAMRAMRSVDRARAHAEDASVSRACGATARVARGGMCAARGVPEAIDGVARAASALDAPTRDACAAALTTVGAFVWVKAFDALAKRGVFSSALSRKLVHITSGTFYAATWPLFSASVDARWFAAFIPLAQGARLFGIGSGLIDNANAVKAVSREGGREELLKGPLYYTVVLAACAGAYWRTSPVGLVVGATYVSPAVIACACALVESLPLTDFVDDNFSVALTAIALGTLLYV